VFLGLSGVDGKPLKGCVIRYYFQLFINTIFVPAYYMIESH
jgi:hypothetical protein